MPHDHAHHHHDHSGHDHHGATPEALADPRYRRVLWWSLWLNLGMGLVEISGGVRADSVSLLADAIDFFGDASNFALSLMVLSATAIWRARTAMLKGVTMFAWGGLIVGKVLWNYLHGSAPQAASMSVIGLMALAVNLFVVWLLYRYRAGDANMRSVWLCSRNDAIGNIAIIGAAIVVALTGGRNWPDLLVAVFMGGLALWSGVQVMLHARHEMSTVAKPQPADAH